MGGARWDYLLFQGLLKMEDVALTLSSGWTELDSSPVNLHSDERQEDGGPLSSLGETAFWLPLYMSTWWALRSHCWDSEPWS